VQVTIEVRKQWRRLLRAMRVSEELATGLRQELRRGRTLSFVGVDLVTLYGGILVLL